MARAQDPGGALFTRSVSGPLGSWVAAACIRLGIHPSVVTLASLLVGTASSALVIASAGQASPWWAPGWAAFVGWQLAYVLDCADGQIARATGKKSEHGARLDVLVDYAVHSSVIGALLAVISEQLQLPVVLLVVAATLWFVGTFTAVLRRSDDLGGQSVLRTRGPLTEIVKTTGDNGATMFVVGGWLLVHPQSVVVPVAAFTVVNAAYLLVAVYREARRSMRVR